MMVVLKMSLNQMTIRAMIQKTAMMQQWMQPSPKSLAAIPMNPKKLPKKNQRKHNQRTQTHRFAQYVVQKMHQEQMSVLPVHLILNNVKPI
jgi:hypothetical protein